METAQQMAAAAAASLRGGGLVILVDEAAGTADLVMAASQTTSSGIAFMCNHARGLTELALSPGRIQTLRLAPMVADWAPLRKPFTVSIEARRGVGTGISAHDRAETIRVAASPNSTGDDLVSPGHVFPIRARLEGHRGRAEAALALANLGGWGEGAVLCTVLDDFGDLAGERPLRELAENFGLLRTSVTGVFRLLDASGLTDLAKARGVHREINPDPPALLEADGPRSYQPWR
jgi:3,4-dihydroxy 2-butanone 4-phosphate synthase/GTP cyclohydrolase II